MTMTLEEAVKVSTRRLQRARSQMLVSTGTGGGCPFIFWATAALHLRLHPVPGLRVMAGGNIATDGHSIIFDPFVYASDDRTEAMLMADVAHEVSHCVKGDIWRVGSRDKKIWNIAADCRIDPELIANGFEGPDHGSAAANAYFHNPRNKGRSAEEIYEEIKNSLPDGGEGGGFAGDGMQGDVQEPTDDPTQPKDGQGKPLEGAARQEALEQLEQQWQIIARQAAETAKAQGKLPSGYEHLVAPVRPKTNPWDLIRYYVNMCRHDDYSFARQNRRSAWRGLALPSLHSEGVGELLVGIDTSGSCSSYIPSFLGFLGAVLDTVKPEKVTFMECDAGVHNVTDYTAYDELPQSMPIHGYGGTSMAPIWEKAEQLELAPVCAIVLTDLAMSTSDFGEPQPYPVLWLTPCSGQAPWGETCALEI
jgi:predicted metal-dependent peptidase